MTSSLSPIVLGGTPLSTMQDAVEINGGMVANSSYTSRADRFWASNTALSSNPIEEVLEIDYASSDVTNTISFDGVNYPHTITIQYTRDAGTDWLPLLDSVTKKPIVIDILSCYPPVLNDPSTIIGHFHPQHDYENHWQTYTISCSVDTIQKIRFVLQRNGGTGPTDVAGVPIPYSLALQNIDTGYRIANEADIPFHLNETDSDTSGQVFANSQDLFRSNLGFSKKTYHASNLINNTDTNAPLIWKSEPQPNPNAVVNFYADLRDATGKGQLIDRIFIDPIYLGCSVNLYYSNDSVTGSSPSGRNGLNSTQAIMNGASISNNGPLNLGTWHPIQGGTPAYFDPYYVQFDNFYLGFDPSIDWWIGIEWTRNWAINTDSLDHDIFSCDAFRIGQNSTNFYLTTTAGDTITLDNNTADNIPIQIVAAYVGGVLRLSIDQAGIQGTPVYDEWGNFIFTYFPPNSVDVPASVPIPSVIPGQLLIGASTNLSTYSGGTITSFILSQSTWLSDDFLTDPSAYSLVPLMASDEDLAATNALIRFDTSQLSATNSTGFIGGPAHPYDAMTWTPIPRTYEMQRGYMKLPLTRAKFWNLEITNLRPENVEKYVPVTRTIKYFPLNLFNTTTPTTSATTRQSDDDLALNVLQGLSSSNSFQDIPQYQGTGGNLSGISNTEVYIATDNGIAANLASLGTQWQYQQFSADYRAPRFSTTCVHNYITEQVTQSTNVSFFAGLRNIVFAKSINAAPQNLPVIEESFQDGTSVGSGNWNQTEQGLYSGSTTSSGLVQSVSVVIPTQTGIRGLQFAAHQSDAQLIDVSGNFSDPNYDPDSANSWTAYGDGKGFGLIYNSTIGEYAYLVSRQSDHGYWGDVVLNWGPTWGNIEANLATYGQLAESFSATPMNEGGIESETIAAPYGGQIHAAVRATASQSLTAPLWVQIIDADTNEVLSEAPSSVSKNQIQQWYTSLDLAELGAQVGETWGDLVGEKIWPYFKDSFIRSNQTTLGQMDSGQVWTTPVGDTSLQISSNAAIATVAGALNQINTGTPFGILSVKWNALTTTTTHASAVAVLDLGNMLLLNDGTFMDTNSSVTYGSISSGLSTGVQYNFYCMLTSQLPSGWRAGIDVTTSPYAIAVTTGVPGSDTLVVAIVGRRSFSATKSITGPINTSYASFRWSPATTQVRNQNFIPSQFSVSSANLIANSSGSGSGPGQYYYTDTNGRTYYYQGKYTYGTNLFATQAISLSPDDPFITAVPSAPSLSTGTGGLFSSGTYYYVVTAINSYGETGSSSESNIAVAPGDTVNLSWTAVTGATNYNVYRGSASGQEYLVGSSGGATTFTDTGDTIDLSTAPPTFNSTDNAGSMMVTDVGDQYGALRFNVTQVPSNMSAGDVVIAYLDYDPTNYTILTLRADGSFWNEGMITRTDSNVDTTTGSASITDPDILASDFGRKVSGDGIPGGAYVGTVTPGVGFLLSSTRGSQTNLNAIATGATVGINISGRAYLGTLTGFNPTAGPLSIYYTNNALLSSTFKSAHPQPNPTSILIFQSATYLGSYSVPGSYSWSSTVRGIGGANNGTASGDYSIIEGFNWNQDGNVLGSSPATTTWGEVDYFSTRTFGDMSNSSPGTTQNLALRVVQKSETNDAWFIQSATFFWDPVIWEFSCDGGQTWWEATLIRNDPNGVLLFPQGLTRYTSLMWRLSSYAGSVMVSHLAIRPWYVGQHGYTVPGPSQLPQGPNVIPTDDYSTIDKDPRWMAWDRPVPHWWWT